MAQERVVVGVDGSAVSDEAVVWAAQEAGRRNAELRIVQVWHHDMYVGSPFFVAPLPDVLLEPEHFARVNAERAREVAQSVDSALEVTTCTPSGPAALTLLDHCRGASLLVIGSTHRTLASRVAFGSVTTHAVAHARCPVVVVRPPFDTRASTMRRPVLVGFDRSPQAELAVQFALEFAHSRGLDLTVLEACFAPAGGGDGADRDMAGLYQETFDEAISHLTQAYPSVAVSPVAVPGHPVDALLDRAESAELLVVGSRGRGWFEGMLLGSVSAALVHQSPVTVAVVRPVQQPVVDAT